MALRLTDEQCDRIREHLPEENYPDDRPGRKPLPARQILEGALWILNTGAQWHMLPQCYPHYKTVHRRFQQWCRNDVLRDALCQLANVLRESEPLTHLSVSSMRRSRRPRVVATTSDRPSAEKA